MPRYTDGVEWFDCVECSGLRFAVTAGGKIAFVELFDDPVVINPVDDVVKCGENTVLQTTELETERTIDDESTDTWLHIFDDVYLEDSPAIFSAFVSSRRISSVTRFS